MVFTGCRGIVACAIGLISVAASAHDEDWRKLADRLPPVYGPIVRGGDTLLGAARLNNASGVTLLSQVPLNNFAGNQVDGNDCWGYTSPSGREYAIIGLRSAFGFVEITDPTNPVIIATIPSPTSIWHDVKVIGSYAYGVSEGGGGVQVMDLAQIDNGTVTLVANSQVGGHSTTHNIVSNEDAGTLYLAGANIGNGGLIRLDLTNPEQPAIAGGWTDMYVHDAQVVTWQSGPLAGREIAFCATGFNGGDTQTGLRVVDMTDPAAPVLLDSLFYPNAGYAHQVWMTEDQTVLYLNDELDEQFGFVGQTTTRVIDITDPTNLVLKGTFSAGVSAIDHNMYVKDGLLYQANYRSGLRVFETSDPLNPMQIGFFDTFPNSDSAQFNGAWSVYPFFESGSVIVSDIERGLFVLRVDPPQPSVRIRTLGTMPDLLPTDGGTVISAEVRALFADLESQSVEMIITDASGTQSISGTPNGGGRFSFTVPPVACGSDVSYYFTASTTEGVIGTLPVNLEAETLTASPSSAIETIFADNFESNTGWAVSGNASDGQWTRGVPVNAGRADPPADADGSGSAFLTDNDASNGGNSDVDNGVTTITSPAFDTTGGAIVSYSFWFDTFATVSIGDSLRAEISFNNGQTWSLVADHVGAANVWRENRYTVDTADGTAATRVRFTASDIGNQNVIEAGVDAFRVERSLCVAAPPCSPADLAAPTGLLTPADLLAFIEAPFDANTDTQIDFFDLIEFATTYDAGCP